MSGTSDRNPFVGPRSMKTGEVLLGRETETFDLSHHLKARRVVVLHSPSGSGKSSLVRAGLIPRLHEGGFDVWRPIRVGFDPQGLEGVPEGVNRYLLSTMVSLEEELPPERRRSPAQLCGLDLLEYVDSRPRRKSRGVPSVVLLFDQLEEVIAVAPCAVEAKREFFAAVGRVLDTERYWALMIIREDCLPAFAPYRELVPTQLSNTFRLELLGLEGARQAAEQLALLGGRSFPAVDQLVRDLSTVRVQQPDGGFVVEQGSTVEPLQLQAECRRLWAAMPAGERSIDAAHLGPRASVSDSLAACYADAVRAIAGEDRALERSVREWVGQRLIIGGNRSQVRQGVGKTAGLDNEKLAKLLDSCVLRTEQWASTTWYELAHDRMVDPILQDNERWVLFNLHSIHLKARRWEQADRPPELLLDASMLRDAARWAKANPGLMKAGEREYLERSQRLRRGQAWARRKRWAWAAALALLVALLFALWLAGPLLAEPTPETTLEVTQSAADDGPSNAAEGAGAGAAAAAGSGTPAGTTVESSAAPDDSTTTTGAVDPTAADPDAAAVPQIPAALPDVGDTPSDPAGGIAGTSKVGHVEPRKIGADTRKRKRNVVPKPPKEKIYSRYRCATEGAAFEIVVHGLDEAEAKGSACGGSAQGRAACIESTKCQRIQ